ncbi:S1 family peptidase [Streptomyces lavenduligriseus]|uniref:S1 family peptidase n=1 Tax=Streptomyces lavenduligriseus TaxID=67315 RepID=A0ABT0P696_9ACTN|nr:S1 family peptidase [Streptomyces lavenduligriseus]MCL3999130.1 S1 family peptidase [Streptomyces lavenduligriseus]
MPQPDDTTPDPSRQPFTGVPDHFRQAHDAIVHATRTTGPAPRTRRPAPALTDIHGVGYTAPDRTRPGGPDNLALIILTRHPMTETEARALLRPHTGDILDNVPLIVEVAPPSTLLQDLLLHQNYVNPASAGVSIGRAGVDGSGTLGFLATRRDTGETLIVSCWHVIAGPYAQHQDALIQPSLPDQFARQLAHSRLIGWLDSWSSPIGGGLVDDFDCACAVPHDPVNPRFLSTLTGAPKFEEFKPPVQDVDPGVLNQGVLKSGRTTGVTSGYIHAMGTHNQNYYGQIVTFTNTLWICTNTGAPFAQPGDSGSCIAMFNTGRPVGMLYAGDTTPQPTNQGPRLFTYATPIQSVLHRLNLEFRYT